MELNLDSHIEYCGYRIKRKQDWTADQSDISYVVTKAGLNALPGLWFKSTDEAKKAISCLELARLILPPRGQSSSSVDKIFWHLMNIAGLK